MFRNNVSSDGVNRTFVGMAATGSHSRLNEFGIRTFDFSITPRQGYPDLTDEMNLIAPSELARSTTNIIVSNPFVYDALSALIMQAIDEMVSMLVDANDLVINRFLNLVDNLIRLTGERHQYRERIIQSLNAALDQMVMDVALGVSRFSGAALARLLQISHMSAYLLVPDDIITAQHILNRQHDEAIINNGFIYSQTAAPQNNLRIGLVGNGAAHGCGPFAAYNALFHFSNTDSRPLPSSIIRALDMMGAFLVGGALGTNPEALFDFLSRSGRQTDIEYLPLNLDGRVRGQDVGILLYIGDWSTGYVHYVMFRHDGDGYLIYNWYPTQTEPRPVNSMNAWVNQGERRYTNLALITIQ